MTTQVDPATGLHIPQPTVPLGFVGFGRPIPKGFGSVTYRCHSCGQLIVKPWEVLFVDDTPGAGFSTYIQPVPVTKRTTTHHDWHMQSQQREDD